MNKGSGEDLSYSALSESLGIDGSVWEQSDQARHPIKVEIKQGIAVAGIKDLIRDSGDDPSEENVDWATRQLYRIADVLTDKILASPTNTTVVDEHRNPRPAKSELLELATLWDEVDEESLPEAPTISVQVAN